MIQRRVSHALDMQNLAGDVANNFALRVKTTDKPLVYVAPGPADMPFAGPFKSYLEQDLMRRGYAISQTARGAEVVNFEVQPFLYGAYNQKHIVEYATFWTTAAYIGQRLSTISPENPAQAYGAAAAIGPILDFLGALDQSTQAEVILKVSVTDANRVYYVDNRSFYVLPSDLPFYMTAMPNAEQMMSADSAGLPVVPLRINSRGY
jgi:hypothetical protein